MIVFDEMPLFIARTYEGAGEPSLRGSRASEAICLRLALCLGRLLRLWLARTVTIRAFCKNECRKRDGNKLPCSVNSPTLFTAVAGNMDLP